jgi:glycolate oxidase FAD binding subunit
VIVDVSLKVLPMPACERTLRFEMVEAQALQQLNRWGGQPLPLSASCWHLGQLWARLSGAEPAVEAAVATLGGTQEPAATAESIWRSVREQQHDFFAGAQNLWRFSLPSNAAQLGLGAQLIEWGGALRWLRSDAPADTLRKRARELGGHATLFRGISPRTQVFTPLSPASLAIHRRLKQEMDPSAVFNPGRMYAEF